MQFQCWIGHCICNSVLSELRANRTQNHPLWLCPLYNEPSNHQVVARLRKGARAEIGQIGDCYQVIANDIEVDPFGRCRGDIGKLVGASECVLHKRMGLWARLAKPIAKIAGRSLIEINDVGVATIDREITRAVRSEIPDAGRRPTKQVLRAEISGWWGRAGHLNPVEIRSPVTNDRAVELKRVVVAGNQIGEGRLY